MLLLRGGIRLVGFFILTLIAVIWVSFGIYLFRRDATWVLHIRQQFIKVILAWLGVKIVKSGKIHSENSLYIGNHRSYLDPVVLMRYTPALPVAKAEVGKWFFIGFAIKLTGILLVQRDSKTSRYDTLLSIKTALKNGLSVLIYPEGTTTKRGATLPFQRGAFRVAAAEGIGIVPITIVYVNENDAWVGKDTFLPHFIRCFGKRKTIVFLDIAQPIFDTNMQKLLETTQLQIDNKINELEKKIN